MNLARFAEIFRQELRFHVKRPLLWIWIALLVLLAWGVSRGDVRIMDSGDSATAGAKAWITSEFAQSAYAAIFFLMFYGFFVAVAAGMSVVRDEEAGVGPVLHTTCLEPSEYIWGKWCAAIAAFGLVAAVHIGASIAFNHLFVGAKQREYVGPLDWIAYVRPALVFGLPGVVAIAGVSFTLGALTRRPILVYFLPVALLLACVFFLWSWKPTWLSPTRDHLLMYCDPAGYRWLRGTWIDVDRGVEFYNHARVEFDWPFLLSRLAWVALGFGSVAFTTVRFARALRGEQGRPGKLAQQRGSALHVPVQRASGDLRDLGMHIAPRPWLLQMLEIARVEWRELRSSPGLYLFVPLILLQIGGTGAYAVGAFDTPILPTAGLMAARAMNTIALLVTLLLLFYSVESMERERRCGIAGIHRATPIRPSAILFGKALANSAVALAVILGAFVASIGVMLYSRQVALEIWPFVACWGLLVPSFVVWTSFVMCVQALTRNRYLSYAVGLAVLLGFGWLQSRGDIDWTGNWMLWSTLVWSDFGSFDINGGALLLSRLFALALAGLLLALAIRFQGRRQADEAATLARLRPAMLWREYRWVIAYALVPLGLALALERSVDAGFQGDDFDKQAKDYWRANASTWLDAPKPSIVRAEVEVELMPDEHALASNGTFTLENRQDQPFERIALTTGGHWRDVAWTLDDVAVEREGKTLLHVLPLARPLAPGERVRLGFSFHGRWPDGPTENGGGSSEFVLPAGAVLTSFTPSFVPVVGFVEGLGIDEENRSDPREYPQDHWKGPTLSGFGVDVPYPVRVTVRGPADWRLNSVGVLESDEVVDGERVSVWASDHPVQFFNIVAGRWLAKRGAGTVLYYHPRHAYNVDEMSAALEAARRRYSEWFLPFPWQELKLSEFPGLSGYAQGFATNITFSESIGFLTESSPKSQVAWLVVAHEAAHQWWGNLLSPGKGPGGNILSEGMSHFSTLLLFEAEKGERDRIEFAKRIEERYGERRQVDSERCLLRTDGNKDGDETVTYDKGGWVFWMLLNHLGRERGMQGYRDFIERYTTNPDHPLLEDFLAVMREHAADPLAFDAFAHQWFQEVVVPEYVIAEAERSGPLDGEGGRSLWTTRVRVRNKGTGRMPIQVAVARGERFPEAADKSTAQLSAGEVSEVKAATRAPETKPAEPYYEERALIELGAGEEQTVTVTSTFSPERVVIDPDALVLQLNRKFATKKLE
jgi:ABC-type transport system involved in multi-copper enzyme maturation permease subunit